MTDAERRGLDCLTHHADRLEQLIRVLGNALGMEPVWVRR